MNGIETMSVIMRAPCTRSRRAGPTPNPNPATRPRPPRPEAHEPEATYTWAYVPEPKDLTKLKCLRKTRSFLPWNGSSSLCCSNFLNRLGIVAQRAALGPRQAPCNTQTCC